MLERLALLALTLCFMPIPAVRASPDEEALRDHCDWLERAIAREPNRDDAFGMFMNGQRPKCQAFLEALARKDGSVREESMREVVNELKDLREVIDAEHGGPPPALPKPVDEAAAKKASADQTRKAEAERKAAAEQARKEEAERKQAAEDARRKEVAQARKDEAARKQAAEEERRAKITQTNDAREEEKTPAEAGPTTAEDEAYARRLMEDALREEGTNDPPGVPIIPPNSKGTETATAAELDGTWQQLETRVLDKWVKRTLNLFTRDGVLEGELYEEVWFPAPRQWRDTSCNGNDTFRMVTTARVTGKSKGARVTLSREVPRILTCTCGARCTVESRRRGMELTSGSNGRELTDDSGVFLRPGLRGDSPEGPAVDGGPELFVGTWETRAFSQRDRKIVQRLELNLVDGVLQGAFYEKSTQGLPLSDWSERFCDGASSWDWVTQWRVSATVKGRTLELKAREGAHAICTCPSKCVAPKSKLTLRGGLSASGVTLELDSQSFERR